MVKKYSAKESKILNAKDLGVFQLNHIQKMTNAETANVLGISVDTVKRIKGKESYNELIKSSLQNNNFSLDSYAKGLIEMTTATKTVFNNGLAQEVPDHAARTSAMKLIGDIYGSNAPKDTGRNNGINTLTDEDLLNMLTSTLDTYHIAKQERPDMEAPVGQ